MDQTIDDKLRKVSKDKYLLYYEMAMRKLKEVDKEFKELSDKNDRLYKKHEIIWRMSDGLDIDLSTITNEALNDLVKYHQNHILLYDALLMEFYRIGKKDLYHKLKELEIL